MAVDSQTFRNALAHWSSGVTIVTTRDTTLGAEQRAGRHVGITASSLTSVSLNPPQILICVASKLYTHEVIQRSGVFAVNILHEGQLEWGMRFAGMLPEVEDRFADITTSTAVTGSPILPDVLGWLDCKVSHAYEGGDHTIYVGEVLAAGYRDDIAAPLLYFHRHWRHLALDTLELASAARH